MANALKWAGAGIGLWLLARKRRRRMEEDVARDRQDELIDETSDQSFPASDPPARW
jgi:hypothetical protein